MFFKTLFIGGAIGLVTSFFVMSAEYAQYFNPIDFKELLGVTLFFLGYGLVFTVIAQTGFFAYLFINQYGGSLFRALCPTVQLLFVILVVSALIYVPPKHDIYLISYIIFAIVIFEFCYIVDFIIFLCINITIFIIMLFFMI